MRNPGAALWYRMPGDLHKRLTSTSVELIYTREVDRRVHDLTRDAADDERYSI
jgi:hypothetical protein